MGETGPPRLWLTFDDGPSDICTDRVLATLERLKLKGTFFMIGREAYAHPDVVRRVHEAGHRVGNHSYTHPHLSLLSAEDIAKEILATEALAMVLPLAGGAAGTALLRPPYGDRNDTVARVASRLGYYFCLWNVDPDDWRDEFWVERAETAITARLADKTLTKDCVVLLHDIHPHTVAGLESFVQMLGRIGVTIEHPSTLPFDLIPTVPPRSAADAL
jgi:peptidoglycan-N-acetylglucosamine deacetylase